MNDYKINLESLLLSYYIKYDRLLPMVERSLGDSHCDVIDVYIDLYDLLKPIYTTDIYANSKFLIVSSIINLAAHMRGYFRTRHRIYARIYLVYGESISDQHKVFCPSFGDDSFRQTINYQKNNEFIKSQLKLLQILCGYISDIYYVPKAANFSMFTYDNIMRNDPSIPVIILSKSKYVYQIPALLQQVKIFRPKKSQGNDISYIISKPYIFGNLYSKISNQQTLDNLSKINPSLCSLMMAITGLSSYGVHSLMNVTSASRVIYNAIYNNRIINDYNSDIEYVYSNIPELQAKIDPISFRNRFNAIDLVYQHRIYNSTPEARDITWLINLNDPKTVKDINNKYFINNPLDLNSL